MMQWYTAKGRGGGSCRWSEVKVAQWCLSLCNPIDCSPWNSPGQNPGVGSLSLFQGIFPTHLNPGRRRQWHPTPVLLPGKSHGWRILEGCSPWGRWGLDTTAWLHFHFSLSCIEEGIGYPLQWSCLENPRDGRAWWAAVYGVAQSLTWLKWLSSSSSSFLIVSLGFSVYSTTSSVNTILFLFFQFGFL